MNLPPDQIRENFKKQMIQEYPEMTAEQKQAMLSAKTTEEITLALKMISPLVQQRLEEVRERIRQNELKNPRPKNNSLEEDVPF